MKKDELVEAYRHLVRVLIKEYTSDALHNILADEEGAYYKLVFKEGKAKKRKCLCK